MTFGIVASSHPLAATGYAAAVLADSPYAYYRFNDASGNPADSSGNGRNATSVNSAPTYHTTGGPVSDGGYLTFDGSNDYVTLGGIDDWVNGATEGSVEFWFRTSAATTSRQRIIGVIDENVGATEDQAFIVHINENNQTTAGDSESLGMLLRDQDSDGATGPRTDLDSSDNTWRHVVITWESVSDSYTLYVNNVEDTTLGGGAAVADNLQSFQRSLIVGACDNRGSIVRPFAGDVAEIAFYTSVLSSTRVAAHYNAA